MSEAKITPPPPAKGTPVVAEAHEVDTYRESLLNSWHEMRSDPHYFVADDDEPAIDPPQKMLDSEFYLSIPSSLPREYYEIGIYVKRKLRN